MSTPKILLRGRLHNPISIGMGVFDGFHLGHASIFNQVSHLLTFDPPPEVLFGRSHPKYQLTTLREQRHLIKNLLVVSFTRSVSRLSAHEFLDWLYQSIQPYRVVVGYDFRFGNQKLGDFTTIQQWATPLGIEAIQAPPVVVNQTPIKSSHIRQLLIHGDISQAVSLLGHPYLIIGHVVKGEGRGAKLGFPTANLQVPHQKLIPPPGVYQATVTLKGHTYVAMVYIGKKPTFGNTMPVGIEVYIHGFHQSIYGRYIPVMIFRKIRGEIRFNSADALVKQLHQDLASCITTNF